MVIEIVSDVTKVDSIYDSISNRHGIWHDCMYCN